MCHVEYRSVFRGCGYVNGQRFTASPVSRLRETTLTHLQQTPKGQVLAEGFNSDPAIYDKPVQHELILSLQNDADFALRLHRLPAGQDQPESQGASTEKASDHLVSRWLIRCRKPGGRQSAPERRRFHGQCTRHEMSRKGIGSCSLELHRRWMEVLQPSEPRAAAGHAAAPFSLLGRLLMLPCEAASGGGAAAAPGQIRELPAGRPRE